MDHKKSPPVDSRRAILGDCHVNTITQQPAHFTRTVRRYKCPVHHGKNLSVAVGYINGRAWAKCHSQDCASKDILAALGLDHRLGDFGEGAEVGTAAGEKGAETTAPLLPRPPTSGGSSNAPSLRLRSRLAADSLRPAVSIAPLPPVSPFAASEYLKGILRPSGSVIEYQRNDGQSGRHWRSDTKRRSPGITGDGWQLRRFDPIDPARSTAIALAEGEKDAAILATAGLIAFSAPRGAGSLPSADFTELVDLAKAKALPVLLCGDNDEPGREAMRKVRSLLKKDHHLDTTDVTSLGPEKGSVADLPAKDLEALLLIQLSDPDPRWQKPIRARKQYLEFKCPRPKRNIKGSGDGGEIWALVPCGNTATCAPCGEWETFLHVERCWRGRPAQMIQVSGFGEVGSTIAETVGMGKVYRGKLEDRLREKPDVHQKQDNPSGERRVFLTALALGDDYRASLTMFFSSPLSAKQIAKERRRLTWPG